MGKFMKALILFLTLLKFMNRQCALSWQSNNARMKLKEKDTVTEKEEEKHTKPMFILIHFKTLVMG